MYTCGWRQSNKVEESDCQMVRFEIHSGIRGRVDGFRMSKADALARPIGMVR